VPFTVTIDEAPGRFRSVSLYIRAANQGEDSSAVKERAERQRLVGFELGQLPVFVPERATAATADGATFLAGEEFVGETAPTEFTPDTLPQGFDYEAGRCQRRYRRAGRLDEPRRCRGRTPTFFLTAGSGRDWGDGASPGRSTGACRLCW